MKRPGLKDGASGGVGGGEGTGGSAFVVFGVIFLLVLRINEYKCLVSQGQDQSDNYTISFVNGAYIYIFFFDNQWSKTTGLFIDFFQIR